MGWTGEAEIYRYARLDDLPAFSEMLQDPEIGQWLWFCPISAELVSEFFTPFLEAQGLRPEGARPGYRLKETTRHTELLFGAMVSDLPPISAPRSK